MFSFARKNGKTKLETAAFENRIDQISKAEIIEIDQVIGHEVETLVNATADILDARFGRFMSTGSYRPHPSDKAIYVMIDGQIVSLLLWALYDNDVWIGMAWTRDGHTRRGYYKLLYNRLKEIAKANGYNSISCGVSFGNQVSRSVHESIGMTPFSVQYTEVI